MRRGLLIRTIDNLFVQWALCWNVRQKSYSYNISGFWIFMRSTATSKDYSTQKVSKNSIECEILISPYKVCEIWKIKRWINKSWGPIINAFKYEVLCQY